MQNNYRALENASFTRNRNARYLPYLGDTYEEALFLADVNSNTPNDRLYQAYCLFGKHGILPEHIQQYALHNSSHEANSLKKNLYILNHYFIETILSIFEYNRDENTSSRKNLAQKAAMPSSWKIQTSNKECLISTFLPHYLLPPTIKQFEKILAYYLGSKISIKQFFEPIALAKKDYSRLSNQHFNCLGENTVIGKNTPIKKLRLIISIISLHYSKYMQFKKDKQLIPYLTEIGRGYFSRPIGLYYKFHINIKRIPYWKLGKRFLGWDTKIQNLID